MFQKFKILLSYEARTPAPYIPNKRDHYYVVTDATRVRAPGCAHTEQDGLCANVEVITEWRVF